MPLPQITPTLTQAQTDVATQGIQTGQGSMTSPGWFDKLGGWDGVGSIADLIGSFGNIYGAIKGVQLAQDQLDFSKSAYNTNLANQQQTYNTSLSDRAYARAHTQGNTAADAAAYVANNSLGSGAVTSNDLAKLSS